MRFSRTERANIKALGLERANERAVVDLRVVGEQRDRGERVEGRGVERLVWPFGDHRRVGKTLGAREGGARIDHDTDRSPAMRAIGASACEI